MLAVELPDVKESVAVSPVSWLRIYQTLAAESVGEAAADSLTPAVPDTAATELPSWLAL